MISLDTIDKEYNEFSSETADSVRMMCNQFERKKAAYNQKMTARKKSGLIDMNRIAMYRTSEEIFQKRAIRPGQKNHKVAILVDWSGSIRAQLFPILMQTITIAKFCKRSKVDFSVFCFSDQSGAIKEIQRNERGYDMNNNFVLMELMNSDLSQKQFDEACLELFSLGYSDVREHGALSLNGTPLNPALVATREYIAADRSKYQSYNLIVLSDGDGGEFERIQYSGYYGDGNRFLDPLTNKIYDQREMVEKEESNRGYDYKTKRNRNLLQTDLMFKLIGDLGVKTTFFYFYNHRPDRFMIKFADKRPENGLYLLGKNDSKTPWLEHVDEVLYVHSPTLFSMKTSENRSRYYVEDEEEEDDSFFDEEIKESMSVNQVTKEFMKVLMDVKAKRAVASRLVDNLCGIYTAA